MKLGFFERVLKNAQISNFMKIRPVETELFRADRHRGGGTEGLTDRHDEAVTFLNFAKAPKKCKPSNYVKLLGFI